MIVSSNPKVHRNKYVYLVKRSYKDKPEYYLSNYYKKGKGVGGALFVRRLLLNPFVALNFVLKILLRIISQDKMVIIPRWLPAAF